MIRLGVAQEGSRWNEDFVTVSLSLGAETYRSSGTSGWFEDELLEVQALLPTGTHLRTCIGCAYSDYSVYGHGFFGHMLCFRNNKAQYLAVTTKREYMKLPVTEGVQETYHCPEWEPRRPGTGYRG